MQIDFSEELKREMQTRNILEDVQNELTSIIAKAPRVYAAWGTSVLDGADDIDYLGMVISFRRFWDLDRGIVFLSSDLKRPEYTRGSYVSWLM